MTCTDCNKPKTSDEFKWCQRCRTRRSAAVARWRERHPELDRQRQRDYGRRRRLADPQYSRKRAAKQKYGLSLEEYDAMLAKGCAICGSHERMHMDHDHATGKVREGLCEGCNHAIGSAREDPSRLRAAADYLERHAA